MSLEHWSQRLERHFDALAGVRAQTGRHIFALEHPLNNTEIEELSSELRARLKAGGPFSPHWLLWVIYATEHGYSYTGDEYWPSFEKQTPGWEVSNRHQLAHWFRKFQNTYKGVIPSGRWADHFRIISRPITHAILPKYLQIQFARTLFDLRYRLAGLATLEPVDIGRLLAVNTYYRSSRFEKFLQQRELTGRIVLALLGETPDMDNAPIYPSTLRRIVTDLERVRNAREWLDETRRFVKDRFMGIGTGLPGLVSPTSSQASPVTQDAAQFDVRPHILLSHRGGATWSVWLEVPSFRNLATVSDDVQSFLRRTRCRLNGANDFKPAGWLLSGKRKGVLKSWPDPGRPLIQFEQFNGSISNLLETECRLSTGPVWLFRVSGDGTAHEIAGRIVRPGCSYVVVTTGELPEPHSGMNTCSVDCIGIKAFRLQMSSTVSTEDTVWLKKRGLQVARTIRVWPAGLPSRGWDGEGSSAWLTTEAPCFGILHDHPVDAYLLCLNNGPETKIEAEKLGHPVFVQVAPLPVGKHTLTVKARRSPSLDDIVPTPAAEGFIELHVREPEPWIPGVPCHSGLIVTLDPHDADLDTFWRNDVGLSVLGPESRSVTLAVSLNDKNGGEILSKRISDPMELPILPEAWREKFARFLKREQHAWSYLEAASGQLEIEGEELGRFFFRFEHDIVPLRWIVRRARGDVVVRLIDDTGLEEWEPDVFMLRMDRPLKEERLSPETALSGMVVEPAGALFCASQGEHCDSVVVSTGGKITNFGSLGINPDFRGDADAPAAFLRRYAYWYKARLYGPLVDVRRRQIVDGLLRTIYETLCGRNWESVDEGFRNTPDRQHAIDTLKKAVEQKFFGFAAGLRDAASMIANPAQASQEYSDLAESYHVSTDRELCDVAFRLASEAEAYQLPDLYGKRLDQMLNAIRHKPAILCGARFLRLLCADRIHGQSTHTPQRSK